MGEPAENLAAARGTPKPLSPQSDGIATFFAPEAVVQIFPSRFFPSGSREGLGKIRAAAGDGNKATLQRYEIKNEMSNGDTRHAGNCLDSHPWLCPSVQASTGADARPLAAFLPFKDGQIVAERNYNCYGP